ncbi:MAG: hypothetical protein Q8M31_08770 [Beijerinckiaceae bacterium]|nr:hypothetical protein [Beijerinckiaceae bacterium]
MTAPSETHIYAGRVPIGMIKPVRDGFEAFVIGPHDELIYLAKARDRREAADLVYEHTARLRRSQIERGAA